MSFRFGLRSVARRAWLGATGALALTGCSPVRLLNAVVPSGGYGIRTQAYGNDARHLLDLYVPDGARDAPVVVFVYGGSWRGGDRAMYRFVGQAFAARGVVVAIPDYRLAPAVRYPAFVEDTAAAVAWVSRHVAEAGGDPRRIVLVGHSAGAYNAAMVALDPRWLRPHGRTPREVLDGWAGLAGPYDFLPITSPDVQQVFGWPDTPRDSQPVAHASAEAPPTLLLAAARDTFVDPSINTAHLAAALRAAGADVTERVYEGLDHATLVGALATPLQRRFDAPVFEDLEAWRKRVTSTA